MPQVSDIAAVMERWAPSPLAEPWDAVGSITGQPDQPVENLILCLDVTEKTLSIAASLPAPLIIAHHPLALEPRTSFSGSDRPTRLLTECIRQNIPFFVAHTNLDQAPGGVSGALADRIGLTGVRPLMPGRCDLVTFVTFVPPTHTDAVREAAALAGAGTIGEYRSCSFTTRGTGTFIPSELAHPIAGLSGTLARENEDRLEMVVPLPFAQQVVAAAREAHPYEEMAYFLLPQAMKEPSFGYGAVGTLSEPMETDAFLLHVAARLGIETLVHSSLGPKHISRVAVMGGRGKSGLTAALASGADAYLTGDVGHHEYLDHNGSLFIIDGTHRATELPILERIRERLAEALGSRSLPCIIDSGESPAVAFTSTNGSTR